MLFDASTTYAPGEPRGDAGYSQFQRVGKLGHYDLRQLSSPNVLVGLVGIAAVAYLVHRYGGRKR